MYGYILSIFVLKRLRLKKYLVLPYSPKREQLPSEKRHHIVFSNDRLANLKWGSINPDGEGRKLVWPDIQISTPNGEKSVSFCIYGHDF